MSARSAAYFQGQATAVVDPSWPTSPLAPPLAGPIAPAGFPVVNIAPARQIVAADGSMIVSSLLGIAIAFGVAYAGAYYGSRAGVRARGR